MKLLPLLSGTGRRSKGVKFTPTSAHGVLDDRTALLLIFALWMLGFADQQAGTASRPGP